MQRNSVTFGSASAPILDSMNANLSFTLLMAARVNAFSTRLIQISMFVTSYVGRSGFLVRAVTSLTCSRITDLTASGSISETVVEEAWIAAVVEARSVSCTSALMALASMVGVGLASEGVAVDVTQFSSRTWN